MKDNQCMLSIVVTKQEKESYKLHAQSESRTVSGWIRYVLKKEIKNKSGNHQNN